MTEPEIEIFHQMLLRCDDIAGKLDYFDVDESLWQHSPYIRDSFLISVSQIGELVSKISPETCRRYFPDIEWQQIRGMRNIIVHVYANVDYDIVWDVVNEEAPKLKQTSSKTMISAVSMSPRLWLRRTSKKTSSGISALSIRLSAMVLMDAFRKTAIALKGTNQPIKTIRGQR